MHNEIIRKLTQDSPFTALICAGILLCSASVRYIALPQYDSLMEKNRKISHYDFYLSSADGFDKIRQEISSKNALLLKKLDSIPSETPSSSVSGILEELIGRAADQGIVLGKIQPLNESRSGSRLNVPVLLEMKTDYNSLGKFTAALEALPQILQITKIALEVDTHGLVDVKMLVTCFVAGEA